MLTLTNVKMYYKYYGTKYHLLPSTDKNKGKCIPTDHYSYHSNDTRSCLSLSVAMCKHCAKNRYRCLTKCSYQYFEVDISVSTLAQDHIARNWGGLGFKTNLAHYKNCAPNSLNHVKLWKKHRETEKGNVAVMEGAQWGGSLKGLSTVWKLYVGLSPSQLPKST